MPVSDSKAMLEKSLWNPRLGICRWTSQRHALLLLVCVRNYQVWKKHPPYRASSVLVSVRPTLPIYLKDALLQVWHDLFHWPPQNMSLYSFALQIFNKCVLVELLDLVFCKETVYGGGDLSFYQWCKTYHVADSILSSFTLCVDDDDDDDNDGMCVCVCVRGCRCLCHRACVEDREQISGVFSPLPVFGFLHLNLLNSSGLIAKTFNHWATSPALNCQF